MEFPLNQSRNSPAGQAHRSFVEISYSRLAANYRSIESTLPRGTRMMPVVKANAYGHGAIPVARKLVECGTEWLAVSNPVEGVELREAGIPLPTRIVVTAGILPFEWDAIVEHSLTPVLHSLADVQSFDSLCARLGRSLPFHFKLDTGLSRLGSIDSPDAIAAVFKSLVGAVPEGLMTHFASASDPFGSQTRSQIDRFREISHRLRELGVKIPIHHVDATNSLHYPPHEGGYQLARPGHGIYGYVTPPPGEPVPGKLAVKPVLSWHTHVLLTKHLPAGSLVGYGALHRTTRPTTVAILGVGYADGYPHSLSGIGRVLLRGCFAPVLGAVSMDLTTVDITDIHGVGAGDLATLIGTNGEESIDAHELGRLAGAISYAILTNIQPRVKRVYVP
ncbi:MAG: alanine racemase [Bryobacterales bacterium]|nr:alanine racemase [Bryobacterales bacterium]